VPPDRRHVLIGLGATPLALAASTAVALSQERREKVRDVPDPATFRTGDLLWPKRKGAFVPRLRGIDGPAGNERREWEAERQRMLADPRAAGVSPEVAERLKQMSYQEFEQTYFAVDAPAVPSRSPRAAGQTISVGHVGLIELDAARVPYVVEATPARPNGSKGGVVRTRYADWLRGYSDIQVWHGRLRGIDAAANRRILGIARGQLGKPYDFFNFDLNDDRGFYCSKLVWMCLWRAASIAIDDDPDPRRGSRFPPWFAPKSLIRAKRVQLLHSPGEY
jgi:hypothetical protein